MLTRQKAVSLTACTRFQSYSLPNHHGVMLLVYILQGPCNSDDDYWSYEGVVRGVTEGACDVGFTNNTVFTDYTLGGRNAQPWSTKPASDFRILCRSGGCAPVDEFSTCSNARVSSTPPLQGTPFPPL